MDFPDDSFPIIRGDFTLTGQGVKKVAIAGTAVALAASTLVQVVMLKARAANVGTLYLGASTVTNDETAGTGGLQLAPGDMLTFTETDLAHVFLNGATGDGCSFMYWV